MQNVVPIVIVHGLEQVFEHQRLKCWSNEQVIFVTCTSFRLLKLYYLTGIYMILILREEVDRFVEFAGKGCACRGCRVQGGFRSAPPSLRQWAVAATPASDKSKSAKDGRLRFWGKHHSDLSRPVSIYVYYSTEGVSPRYFQAAPRLPEAAFDAKQPVRSYTLLSLTVFECCNAVYNYIHYRTNYTAPVDHLWNDSLLEFNSS